MMRPMPFFLAMACTDGGSDTGGSVGTDPLAPSVVMATSDYQVGALAVLDLDSNTLLDTVTTVHSDAALIVDDGRVLQLNRLGMDSIRIYSPGQWSAPIIEFSTGDSSNPHEARICGGDLFVSLFGKDYLGVFDPENGESLGHVDLSDWSDGDGLPEAASLLELDGTVLVALQRLEDWVALDGAVVQIECSTQEVIRSWTVGPNPTLHPIPGEANRVLLRTGVWWESDGAIQVLDTRTKTLEEPLIDEAVLGGDTWLLGVTEGGRLVYSSYDYAGDGRQSLHCMDLTGGESLSAGSWPNYLNSLSVLSDTRVLVSAHDPWSGEEAATGVLSLDPVSCEASESDDWLQTTLSVTSMAAYGLDTD
jgi:hypothetical protein